MYVASNFFLQKVLRQLADHAVTGPFSGVLDGTYIGLGQQPTGALAPEADLTAITEATFAGYARQALTWRGPYQTRSGSATLQADNVFFQASDAVTPNQVTTLFVADAITAGNLLLSEPLPGGLVPMVNATSAFGLALLFQLAFGANLGDAVVIR